MRDALGSVQSVLVVGGTSEIALATVNRLVADRTRNVVLAVRDPGAAPVAAAASELRAAGAAVHLVALDLDAPGTHEAAVEAAFAACGPGVDVDVVLLAAGILGRRDGDQLGDAGTLMRTNAAGAVSALAAAAPRLRAQGHGTIVVLSSVAADRPRPANFAYGASKAALDAFARGLAEHLHGSGVDVLVVRPGFVRTKMTSHLPDAPLAVGADQVATAIVDGLRRRALVVYVPAPMRAIALVLRLLPRALLRRLPA